MQLKQAIIVLSYFIVSIVIYPGCIKPPKNCLSYTTAQVTEVVGPNTVLVNQETDFTVRYNLHNGCGQFENLESTSNGYMITISLVAKYSGCMCTDILLSGETIYKFKPPVSGVYYLKFVQPNSSHFIHTVTVN